MRRAHLQHGRGSPTARWLIIRGALLSLVGVLWPWLTRLGLGRLPGDVVIDRDNIFLRHVDPDQYRPVADSLTDEPVMRRARAAPRQTGRRDMRIIAGELRGRRLRTPRGEAIRPTGDRAREALFDILEHGAPTVRGARFLDLFAGTGAVGLEAHSRGAGAVVLVESERAALRLAEANRAQLGAPASVRLLARDATRLGPAPQPFDLVFLDPPYGSGLAAVTLEGLLRHGWLDADARVVVELAATDDLELPEGYALERERRYGRAKFLFLRPSR